LRLSNLISFAAIAVAASLALVGSASANAKSSDKAAEPLPPVFQSVIDCRAVTADSERLACYDRSVTAMATARAKQDLVVADRASITETKRGLFGFSLPHLKLFGSTEGEDVNQIESTISGVRKAADGFAIFVLADGARWKQTDGGFSYAKPGDPIRIRRGAMNGYLAKVADEATIRVVRLAQ
jgi:hypothetical protein